jgi:hypothetical protein
MVKLEREKLDFFGAVSALDEVFLTQLRGSKETSSSERRCIRFPLLAFPKA